MLPTGVDDALPFAYLDHAASSPMRPEALSALVEAQARITGNPSGSHRLAREARRCLDDARDVVAELVGAEPGEVVFTSGGTEADNLAVRGIVASAGGTAVCSAVEHHAVLDTVLAVGGRAVGVDSTGRIDLDALGVELRRPGAVSLVSVMLANNETGVVNDLNEVAAVLAESGSDAVLHSDAVAATAWLDLSKAASPASLVSISAHKVGGPKGVGVLVARANAALAPIITGGGQERERRSGTPDVAGAVAFAAALSAAVAERDALTVRITAQADRLRSGLFSSIPGLVETVADVTPPERTPGTLHLCVPGVDREALLFLLDQHGVAASWGSSCASGASEPSHVLAAMGVADDVARGSLRLSLGWSTIDDEIDHAVSVIPAAVAQLRRPT